VRFSRLQPHVFLVCHGVGRTVRPLGRSCRFGCAALRRCTMRLTSATRRRRWRWSRRARTCTARTRTGAVARGCILVSLGCHSAGRTVRPLGAELQEWLFGLCRWTALHLASQEGHTETALALVTAGADVHCQDNDGYGFSRLHPRNAGVLGWHPHPVRLVMVRGRTVRPLGGGAARVPVLAVQEYGAALGVGWRPHGDGDGAGRGGRGRALQGQ
jgi:hypothetical protein